MLIDSIWYNDTEKMHKAFRGAKRAFGKTLPYKIIDTFQGKKVKFTDRFIKLAIIGLTTGDTSLMAASEANILKAFIGYLDGNVDRDISKNVQSLIPKALDMVMVNIILGREYEFIET